MGYESLHITELLSVQCLQVDDVIPILPILWQVNAHWVIGP